MPSEASSLFSSFPKMLRYKIIQFCYLLIILWLYKTHMYTLLIFPSLYLLHVFSADNDGGRQSVGWGIFWHQGGKGSSASLLGRQANFLLLFTGAPLTFQPRWHFLMFFSRQSRVVHTFSRLREQLHQFIFRIVSTAEVFVLVKNDRQNTTVLQGLQIFPKQSPQALRTWRENKLLKKNLSHTRKSYIYSGLAPLFTKSQLESKRCGPF